MRVILKLDLLFVSMEYSLDIMLDWISNHCARMHNAQHTKQILNMLTWFEMAMLLKVVGVQKIIGLGNF